MSEAIRFYHRGAVRSVQDVAPTRTILQYLREDLHSTGTKEGCAEGDCGACTVVVGTLQNGELALKAVNACIQLMPTLDGRALFTVEDLKQADGSLHPVQQAMVDCHGSQCGFCTPGFVMSLWSLYLRLEGQAGQADPLSRQEIDTALSGNLCRCTGYRPIINAARRMGQLPPVHFDRVALAQTLQTLQREQTFLYRHGGQTFVAPRTLAQLVAASAAHPGAQILAGATDIGLWVTKQMRDLDALIYIGHVAELQTVTEQDGQLIIGAGVTLNDAYAALCKHYPTELSELWQRFASEPIRNAGTLGGNVANGSPIGDSMPFLIALGAEIVLDGGAGQRSLALEDFYLGYQKNALQAGEFVAALRVPLPQTGRQFRTYKLAKRFDQDISAVCAAFSIALDDGVIRHPRIAFGGMAATPKRAANAEAALQSRRWDEATLQTAMAALADDYAPLSDMRASGAYRITAAQNLLRRFWLETRPDAPLLNVFSSAGLRVCKQGHIDAVDAGTEACTTDIGRPHPHESAMLHVLGEATYTDDARELHGTLHAALGWSEQAHATILAIDLEAVKRAPGVIAVLTAADIPGVNDCGPIVRDDPILADGLVQYVGQPVFAVVAASHELARRAARLAKIAYATLPAILTPQAARAAQSYVLPPMHLQRGAAAAALASAPQRVQGTLEVGGQEHFYLEGQVSYAIPAEQHGMLLLCSTQHPSEMQHVLAQALNLPAHNVRVECRRMGGGFGGKESQSALWAAVAAIAAHKLQRPVKLRADRDDDMMVSGKRHCFYYEYEVGFDASGRILAARVEMVLRAGFSADLSGPVATRAVCHVDNAYYLSDVEIHALCGKTNTQSNTAFRGFGGPQGALAIEYAIDDIARTLGIDALEVRKINFYGRNDAEGRNVTPYGQKVVDNVIHALVAELEASSDYSERRAASRAFNAASPVLKKGIALTPVKFGIAFNLTHLNQAGALVHVYLDGSVLVNHGGTEMGQGVNTKVAQVVAHELGIGLAQVRCSATDTGKVANTSATAASTGADINGKAAQDAAGQIRARLAAFAAQQYGGAAADVRFADDVVTIGRHNIPFNELVQKAYLARVQLWSDGFYATPGLHWDPRTMRGNPFSYFCYGAAVSEVVVDTLTGEWKLLRADLLYDVGNSLNPAIDIGQVEGGFIQGMGWLTTEQLWWDKDGKLMTHAPSTYKIPAISDCPEDFRVKLFDNRNAADSIHRSKAAGEPPLLLPFSVFFAIRDAIASVANYRINPPLNTPATGEEILRAVEAVTAVEAVVALLLPLPHAGEGRGEDGRST